MVFSKKVAFGSALALSFLFLLAILVNAATDVSPSGDLNGRGLRAIYNFTTINATDGYFNGTLTVGGNPINASAAQNLISSIGTTQGTNFTVSTTTDAINITLTGGNSSWTNNRLVLNVTENQTLDNVYHQESGSRTMTVDDGELIIDITGTNNVTWKFDGTEVFRYSPARYWFETLNDAFVNFKSSAFWFPVRSTFGSPATTESEQGLVQLRSDLGVFYGNVNGTSTGWEAFNQRIWGRIDGDTGTTGPNAFNDTLTFVGGDSTTVTVTDGTVTIDVSAGSSNVTGGHNVTGFANISGNLESLRMSASNYTADNGNKDSLAYGFRSDDDTGMFLSTIGNLNFATAGVNRVLISSSGRFHMQSGGSATVVSIAPDSDGNTGLYSADSDAFNLAAGGVNMYLIQEAAQDINMFNPLAGSIDFNVRTAGETHTLFIDGDTGLVGMGTETATQKLNVVGDVNVTGSLIVGNTTRTANITMYNETGSEYTCGVAGLTFTCTAT